MDLIFHNEHSSTYGAWNETETWTSTRILRILQYCKYSYKNIISILKDLFSMLDYP